MGKVASRLLRLTLVPYHRYALQILPLLLATATELFTFTLSSKKKQKPTAAQYLRSASSYAAFNVMLRTHK